jgi:hypothetical protein
VLTRARAGRAPLVLFVALWLAALPAVAHGAAGPRVLATSHVPLVAAAGDRLSVTAKVAGTGKRVVIGLVLGTARGSATGGLALGKGAMFSARGTRRVVVVGRVPATVGLDELRTLLVCVDPAGAIGGKRGCRRAARIATSGTSTEERLAGARRAGRLSKARAILFGVLALRGGKRGVPAELAGGLAGPSGEEAAITAAAGALHGLPAGIRRQVLPFFVPPRGQGSAWAPAPKKKSHAKRGHARAAAATLDCRGYAKLDVGYYSGNLYPWRGVPTSDHKAVVWYQVNAENGQVAAQDQATARRYAKELPKIWTKLTKEFGAPLSDGNEPCYHGPDGRYDVYVDSAVVEIESRFARGVLALTIPYPANGTGTSCSHRPTWIAIRNNLSNWALAHEFMHALQFSHRTAACDGPIAWWTEGGATWAGDFVYPDDNTEQRDWPDLVKGPLAQQLTSTAYEAWPFWMMLQRTQDTGVLRSIFASMATKPPIAAVNAAIPGGYATQIPRFFLHAFNQSPVGDAGFALPASFVAWDDFTQTPDVPASASMSLGALPADTLALSLQRADGFPALSVGAYHHVPIPDPLVREIRFTNDLAGKPGAHVDAMLHLADGSWKLADWTSSKEVTLCRDRPGQDVRDMVIVSTNTGTAPLGAFTHTLRVAPTCPFPKRFDGTWTRIYTWPSRGSWTETIHGTATYVRNPLFPPEVDATSQVPYDLQNGSVTWTVSGTQDTGIMCLNTFSGTGTDTPTIADLGLENVSGRPYAPHPEPKPFYYSIRADSDHVTAPEYDVTDCHGVTAKEGIVLPYLDIGHVGPFTPTTLQDEVLKSEDPRLLEGHRVQLDPTMTFTIDDSWSFRGSD